MDNTEQVQSNRLLKCSVCGDNMEMGIKGSIKWNQETKGGYGICPLCVVRFREKKPDTHEIHKDSYNYISTTIRQILNRYGCSTLERTVGSLRTDTYIIWTLRATSPNGYIAKVDLEIKRESSNNYKYSWSIKLYDNEERFLRETESQSPNVPLIKEILVGFMKEVGSDPYAYFLSNVKSIIAKNRIEIRESEELEDRVVYYMGFKSGFNGKIEIDKECKWNIQVYRKSGSLYREYKGKSFALPPLREFFNRMGKEIGVDADSGF